MSVNISLETLVTARGYALLPEDLSGVILEITEHGDVDHLAGTDEILRRLRERGCTIAIDDWGKGHSNLDRMLRLQPEMIKLDLSLVQGNGRRTTAAIIHAIIVGAEEVGALVCAEGIETPEQRDEPLRWGPPGPGLPLRTAGGPRHDAGRSRSVPSDSYPPPARPQAGHRWAERCARLVPPTGALHRL